MDTDVRFPSLEMISAPRDASVTYGTAAKWDQPQSHLAKHYKYLYMNLYIHLCQILAAFNAFWMLTSTKRGRIKKIHKRGEGYKLKPSGVKSHTTALPSFVT